MPAYVAHPEAVECAVCGCTIDPAHIVRDTEGYAICADCRTRRDIERLKEKTEPFAKKVLDDVPGLIGRAIGLGAVLLVVAMWSGLEFVQRLMRSELISDQVKDVVFGLGLALLVLPWRKKRR